MNNHTILDKVTTVAEMTFIEKALLNDQQLQLDELKSHIKVIGIGGGGCNAVNHMINNGLNGVDFAFINTDSQALMRAKGGDILQIGFSLTKGLGAGTLPSVGRKAAMESEQAIRETLKGMDMVFLAAGMGGGTGTGAMPVVAEIAREMGILTVAVVTKPFNMEGAQKRKVAQEGINYLTHFVDSIITIPNQKLLSVLKSNATVEEAFGAANDVLLNAVSGITEVIINPGMINLDFADVKTVMTQMGISIMGIGSASGDNRAEKAVKEAINCQLLENTNLKGARGILVNIQSSNSLNLSELDLIGNVVSDLADKDAIIKVGTSFDESLDDTMVVTVIATGLEDPNAVKSSEEKNEVISPIVVRREEIKELDAKKIINSNEERYIARVSRPSIEKRVSHEFKSFKDRFNSGDVKIPNFLRKSEV